MQWLTLVSKCALRLSPVAWLGFSGACALQILKMGSQLRLSHSTQHTCSPPGIRSSRIHRLTWWVFPTHLLDFSIQREELKSLS